MSDQTAYIVTAGSYSNYGIVAVFLDKAIAEQFVESYNTTERYETAEIEEWDILTEAPHRIVVHAFEVNGDTTRDWDHVVWSHHGIDPAYASIRGDNRVWARGRGLTREEARKAAWDAIARLRAEQEGIA